jgi:pimeloyl-ACP methyl ester carboxylesterase
LTLLASSLVTAGPTAARAREDAAGLIVRGSVEQIHVVHAAPGAEVEVRGPRRFMALGVTDELGGLVIDDVPAGGGYRVRVEGGGRHPVAVRVLSPDRHPSRSFYRRQNLAPTAGYVETRDGTLLAYRVQLPDAAEHADGPFDVVVTYSGYQPAMDTTDSWQDLPIDAFTAAGYAVVGVNMRGSGCSGGAFDFMQPLSWLDGYDVVEALSAQPWVDDVALGDQSWPGLTQLFVASTRPPSLDAIVPGAVVGDFYRDVFFPGGILNSGFGNIWAVGRDLENAFPSSRAQINERIAADPVCAANQGLRGRNASIAAAITGHPYDDAHWQTRNAELVVGKITVPTLQIVSWQDPQVGGRPAGLFERYHHDTAVRFIGTNGFHTYYEGDVWTAIVEFLDVYLRARDLRSSPTSSRIR